MHRWERRERKKNAERRRMPKSGRSVFILVRLQVERAEKIRKESK